MRKPEFFVLYHSLSLFYSLGISYHSFSLSLSLFSYLTSFPSPSLPPPSLLSKQLFLSLSFLNFSYYLFSLPPPFAFLPFSLSKEYCLIIFIPFLFFPSLLCFVPYSISPLSSSSPYLLFLCFIIVYFIFSTSFHLSLYSFSFPIHHILFIISYFHIFPHHQLYLSPQLYRILSFDPTADTIYIPFHHPPYLSHFLFFPHILKHQFSFTFLYHPLSFNPTADTTYNPF